MKEKTENGKAGSFRSTLQQNEPTTIQNLPPMMELDRDTTKLCPSITRQHYSVSSVRCGHRQHSTTINTQLIFVACQCGSRVHS